MNRTDLQGTTLDSDINIISVTGSGNDRVADPFPLDISSLRYLEITDSLVDMGLTGVIAYTDYFEILEKIGITKLADKIMYLSVDITDTQLHNIVNNKVDSNISFISLLETHADLSSNIANKSSVYNFEEAIPALLKKTSAYDILESGSINSGAAAPELISMVLKAWADANNIDDFIDTENFLRSNSINMNISNIWQIEDSVYDVMVKLYNSFVFGRLDNNPLPPLLKFRNNPTTNKRALTLTPIISDKDRQFIYAYYKNVEGPYKDIYQEEFIIADEDISDGNSTLYNKVEQYNLIKPDHKILRQNVWGKYSFTGSSTANEAADLTSIVHKFNDHNKYVEKFNKILGVPSNIPHIELSEQKIFIQLFEGSDPGSDATVKGRILNKVLKSFILLNETIVLNVEGRLYRKAGKFITIKSDGVLSDDDRLSKLWYIIKVKHIFNNGNYTNEITAVRMFGNTEGITINKPTPTNLEVNYDLDLSPGEILGEAESNVNIPQAVVEDGLPQRSTDDGDVINPILLGGEIIMQDPVELID
jgi:hypothetical protein